MTSKRHLKDEDERGRQKEEKGVLSRGGCVGEGRGGRELGRFKDYKG